MDAQTQAELKKKLEETKAQLDKELVDLEKVPELGDEIDALDTEADEAEEFSANQGMALALKERHEAVVAALGKIATGTYGVCEKCKKPIESDLLSVNPESRLCKGCKVV